DGLGRRVEPAAAAARRCRLRLHHPRPLRGLPGLTTGTDTVSAMEREAVLRAFRAEAEALGKAVGALPDASWDLPTRCPPWRVRDLLRHVTVAVGRVPAMLAAPAPDRPEVSAA